MTERKCYITYSQIVFTMEFLISYSLNVLPVFQLQRLGLIITPVLFIAHAWVSLQHNRQTGAVANHPES